MQVLGTFSHDSLWDLDAAGCKDDPSCYPCVKFGDMPRSPGMVKTLCSFGEKPPIFEMSFVTLPFFCYHSGGRGAAPRGVLILVEILYRVVDAPKLTSMTRKLIA